MSTKKEFEIDFLFVGPQRTGTTWLYDHLIDHPLICFPKDVKETMFFDRNFEKGLDWYQWHFTECKEEYKKGEVAPTYFHDEEAPIRINRYFPDCKIIISLRDPIERAKSLYQHHFQKGRVKGSFTEAIKKRPDILTSGYYADHLDRWFQYFDDDQILLITLEEIKNNPDQLLEKLCFFINVQASLINKAIKGKKINSALRPRYHGMAKIASTLVSLLHSYRLHRIVNLAKKVGLKSIFFKESNSKPTLTDKERSFLEDEYSSHINYVNEKFENITL